MAYTFTFEAARKIIRVEQDHPEDLHSGLEAMREMRMHPEFKADYGILCDFRQGEFRGSRLDLFKVSEVIRVFFPGQRLALVYSSPGRERSANLVAAMAAALVEVRVFDDLEAAETWLTASPRT